MFTEPQPHRPGKGWLEVICGPMFSGKTEELIHRLQQALSEHHRPSIYKPSMETRYHDVDIVSHSGKRIACTPVDSSKELLSADADVVGIDEAQFFDDELPDIIRLLVSKGVRVVAAGLDMDFRGIPFGPLPALLSMTDRITRLYAICAQCGSAAGYSHRKTASETRVLLGATEVYEPRCSDCFFKR